MDNNAENNSDRKEDSGASSAAAGGGGNGGGDAKPASGEHLSLKVKSPEGNEVYFKVKKTTTFSKVMHAYCKKVGAEIENLRFLFDGQRLRPEQTPADLDMEDEDEIDAMVQQTGGQ